jgi:hypothetical protein
VEGAHLELVKGESGAITHTLIQTMEGDFEAPRK